jgi:cell division protease FtsH
MERENHPQSKPVLTKRNLLIAVPVLLALTVLFIVLSLPRSKQPKPVTLSEVAAGIRQGTISRIEDTALTGEFIVTYHDGETRKGVRDPNTSLLEQVSLLGLEKEQLAEVQFEVRRNTVAAGGNLSGFLLALALVGVPAYVALRLTRKDLFNKKSFSEAQIPDVHFSDVAGLDENIQELRDIVTFLKDGQKFAELGARMPRGALMVGDPGIGKTLIARAVAGEAGVPFFAMSGSEFVEVFVGVGASRVRSLFARARKRTPCIIFIDEIDAIGRERRRSESGAEMEQDQTLNQLLVEMDGFGNGTYAGCGPVIVLAATNRADILDPALTRAGRFDRRLYINRPDVKGREAILRIHTRGKKLAKDVSLQDIARSTPGLVGADLANIVNEAAIISVRSDRAEIGRKEFEEAVEKHIAGGVQRTSQVLSENERKIIAFHEAGHALVIHATEQADPVHKITIIPRGQAGGYTMALPESDSLLVSRCKLLARITGLLGGRAAEEIFFQDITNGASNDLNVATQLAEEMVMRLGMDRRAGLRVVPQQSLAAALGGSQKSQKTCEAIDEAINGILEDCYTQARRILTEKRQCVERLASALLEQETLGREEFLALVEGA